MATATETLQATLSKTGYGILALLAESADPLSGRKVAKALSVAPTTANNALGTLAEAGYVTSEKSGRATLWRLVVSHPAISAWLEEVASLPRTTPNGSSPYSTGGGGVRLEHSYATCLIAGLLAGEVLPELGASLVADVIRLQASDLSDVDDILIEGRDVQGEVHRSSIAVRRSPLLTRSDTASVPLFRDFLTIILDRWEAVEAGHWRLILAVSSNANAIGQLADLAELARSVPSGEEFEGRLAQPGRNNAGVRDRQVHIKDLVEQAVVGLTVAPELSVAELTWRLLSNLTVRTLRLERTDRTDRTNAVNMLQRVLVNGTPAAADALYSRIEELVGTWAPQAAVLTQSLVRRSLSDYPLARSSRYANGWAVLDRLGARLRDSIRPALRSGSQIVELERPTERSRLEEAMRSVGGSAGSLVVTGNPDVGKSALSLRVTEVLQESGAAVTSLSLRDLPQNATEFELLLGGFSLDEVLAASEARPVRLILVDGTESVLEGKAAMLQTLATAALRAGVGVIAVTRSDGSRQVSDVLTRSNESAGLSAGPVEHAIGPLTPDERNHLAATFPALERLGSDRRANWLLGRPGLVDALLRTGDDLDPAEFLCEADVFGAVWASLIRRNEDRSAGASSPDDRERAVLSVAKRSLGLLGDQVPGTAAAELRSDGVLRLPNNPALSPGDEFSTDLFRDFALCRLFIVEGWQALATAGAPRWSIRAARLACQAALSGPEKSRAWSALAEQFARLAQDQGDRWLEVPFEALMTLGDAEQGFRELWDTLASDSGSALATLLRSAEARYVSGTIGDAFALAPLIRVAFCDRLPLERGPRFGRRTIHEVIEDLVLAWLRGMATVRVQPDGLRQAVRDTILGEDRPSYDDFAVEALATLGADLDDRAEAWLRDVAKHRPADLSPAVESAAVAVSMSQARPQLLLELAEAYYVELPDPTESWGGDRIMDDGIRDFNHGLGSGFGVPAAAWYYGPFFRLLNARPIETIKFINRMLDHAARFRVEKVFSHRHDNALTELEGVHLDLYGSGPHLFVGDSHVWAWYRGTSVGPYACMSALLALERFIDYLLEKVDVPVRRILEMLLIDCHNLAVPGLIVGFLTRHPKATGDLLDPFLSSPAIWHLETARVTGDYGFRVRDPDADKLTGADRRRYTFHEIVGGMVVNARLAGDDDRLATLASLGQDLIASARAASDGDDENYDDYLAMVESWAAEFRVENYQAITSGERVVIQFVRPEPIERVMAPRNEEIQTTNVLYGLQHRYGRFNDNSKEWPIEDLDEDLATARRIEESSDVLEDFFEPENALVSVAAAAIRAHALGLKAISQSDLEWAIEAVLWAAENPRTDEMSYHETTYTMGADRAAAAVVPLLLVEAFDTLKLDRQRLDKALLALATSLFDEVRAIYAQGCETLWLESCELAEGGVCRRHMPVWSAAVSGLRDSRLGSWNQETQRRENDVLLPPFDETLLTVADDSLLVNRLRMPLTCMVDAQQVSCLHNEVSKLWSPLWDSYRRAVAHSWAQGYDRHGQAKHEPIARRLIDITLSAGQDLLKAFIETLAANSNALHLLFDGFATVLTYDDEAELSKSKFWPQALETALDAIGDGRALRSEGHWFDYMVAALLPTPNPHSWDSDIDGTLTRSRKHWIQPEDLGDLAERWLQLARHQPKGVDAVIKFSKSAPPAWQTSVALDWVEMIIDGRFELIANRTYYLEEWLSELRNAGLIRGEVRAKYNRVIDGLAAGGDRAAVRLQQLDE